MEEVDVAVVGGGPGGLAAACAILKTAPHLKVRVFERARGLRAVGFAIGLGENGYNALEAIDEKLERNVYGHVQVNGGVETHNIKSEQTSSFPSSKDAFGASERAGFLPWYKLQGELADWLPKECLVLDSTFHTLEQTSSGVCLKFVSSAGKETTYGAKVVVGADGNQSRVRQCVLNDGPPHFLNTAIWRGQVAALDDWPHDDNLFTGWIDQGQIFSVVQMRDRVAWQAFAPCQLEDLGSLSTGSYVDAGKMGGQLGVDKLKRAAKEYSEWPQTVQGLIASTPPETVTEHGQFYREASECGKWGKRSVTLLGDAAHLMTPFLGQGTSQTLLDAVEIGRAIGEHGACEEALRAYEEFRIGGANQVQEASVAIAKDVFSGKPNTEAKWLKKHPDIVNSRPRKLSMPLRARPATAHVPQMRATSARFQAGSLLKMVG